MDISVFTLIYIVLIELRARLICYLNFHWIRNFYCDMQMVGHKKKHFVECLKMGLNAATLPYTTLVSFNKILKLLHKILRKVIGYAFVNQIWIDFYDLCTSVTRNRGPSFCIQIHLNGKASCDWSHKIFRKGVERHERKQIAINYEISFLHTTVKTIQKMFYDFE